MDEGGGEGGPRKEGEWRWPEEEAVQFPQKSRSGSI